MSRQIRDRRGVLLLVVLTLLALFAAITVTFVVLAGQYRRSSISDSKMERQGDPPQKLLNDAVSQVIRGTEVPLYPDTSPADGFHAPVKWFPGIKGHSLLEDAFGQDGFSGVVSSAATTPLAQGQLIQFTVQTESFQDVNNNDRYDAPEPWIDLNSNGAFELGTDHLFDYDVDNQPDDGEPIIGDTGVLGRYEGPRLKSGGNYAGCVLTMLSGHARDMSTRIVSYGYDYNSRTASVTVMAFGDLDPNLSLVQGDKCLINGRPYNGTGPGFDITWQPNDNNKTMLGTKIPFGSGATGLGNLPTALLPNLFARLHHPESGGGADEDYDIADYQNMMLAFSPNPGVGLPHIPSMHRQHLVDFWFHEFAGSGGTPKYANPASFFASLPTPADKWQAILFPYGLDGIRGNNDTGEPTLIGNADKDLIASLRRSIIFRPLPEDHPNFTGSNPNSRPTQLNQISTDGSSYFEKNGPWDVDNDGDGFAESIWVDLGFPVQTAPDGRRFKPLFAIHCTDLDGRLNVNAHGSPVEVDQYATPLPVTTAYLATNKTNAMATSGDVRGFGLGFGTPEIRLGGLFTNPSSVEELYYGHSDTSTNPAHYTEGRYGELSTGGDRKLPGLNPGANGAPGTDAVLSRFKQFGVPLTREMFDASNGWPIFPTTPGDVTFGWSAYGTPCDYRGTSWTGIDQFGQPVTWGAPGKNATGVVLIEPFNDHYEIDLSHKIVRGSLFQGARDNPFQISELERILRSYDGDATALPDRLRHLLDENELIISSGDPKHLRQRVTTHQYDLPSPSVSVTRELALSANNFKHAGDLTELLVQRLLLENTTMTVDQAQQAIRNGELLSPELLQGRRMDLNRPFGNGRDDNGDSVVDEPAEALQEVLDMGLSGYNFNMDLNNDGVINNQDKLARQYFAKDLYILLMLLKGPGNLDLNGDGIPTTTETAYTLAQYAINVVDFRDRDVINTPFEFDINPFKDDLNIAGSPNTWNVDGTIGGSSDNSAIYRGLVWGCERPEVLISETLAFHDRRTEDTDQEQTPVPGGSEKGKTTDMDTNNQPKDSDFDQRLQPRGAFFVELYNPWSSSAAARNIECYQDAQQNTTNNHEFGVVLSKVTPTPVDNPTDTTQHGVWRLLIVKVGIDSDTNNPIITQDPDDPVPANRPTAERSVYFCWSQNVPSDPQHGEAFCVGANMSLPFSPLWPGRYAVVGGYSRTDGSGAAKRYSTLIGRHKDVVKYPTAVTDLKQADSRRIEMGVYPNEMPPITTAAPITSQIEVKNNENIIPLPPAAADKLAPVAILIDSVKTGSGGATTRRLSISEPVGGYTAPSGTFVPGTDMGEGAYSEIQDTPFDNSRFPEDGTCFSYAVVHLQRLADPTRKWDTDANPYLTVDSMTVDLTVFNGVWDTPDPGLGDQSNAKINFATTQRGNVDNTQANRLWRHEPPTPNSKLTTADGTSVMVYKYPLNHTLGYINKEFLPSMTSGDVTSKGLPSGYIGAPKEQPFPWLTWNNRPFVGPLELMLVPKARQSQMLREFDVTTNTSANMYDPSPVMPHRFPHLLNFFKSRQETSNTDSTSLYRVFEYLQVPSRFVGTETFLKPSAVVSDTNLPTYNVRHYPPFHGVSTYRDPGRINLNTIVDGATTDLNGSTPSPHDDAIPSVWEGVRAGRNGFPAWFDAANTSRSLAVSRQGFSGNPHEFPSAFMNPFRSFGGAQMRLPGFPARDEIDVTIFRRQGTEVYTSNNAYNNANPHPLFVDDLTINTSPLNAPWADGLRNPYFYFQDMQRYANLITTRSNVYAIWMTVGYFEVTPWGGYGNTNPNPPVPVVDTVHPDGFQLGQELGVDTGEVQRHRAFYIFDRSLPVGFRRGENLNFDKGMLLKRFIE